ncbi:MAG: helix-turn-helix domain-containing protein [Pirellulales bacterium]
MNTPINHRDEWLLKMADIEDNCSLAVGGLAHEFGMLEPSGAAPSVARTAFAKLIELRRRERRLTVEQLAQRADIDLGEVVGLERGDECTPEPRTVYKLAAVLDLPEAKLMQLSGLTKPKDSRFAQEAVRFAARSEPVDKLSREEHEALEEFVKFLSEA